MANIRRRAEAAIEFARPVGADPDHIRVALAIAWLGDRRSKGTVDQLRWVARTSWRVWKELRTAAERHR